MNPTQTISDRNALFLFIKPQDIKIFCPLSANIEDTLLIPSIIAAQELVILEVLGTQLYERLKAEYISANYNPANLPDATQTVDYVDIKELYAQIYKPLIWHSFARFVPYIGVKIDTKGVMLADATYAENGGLELIKETERRYRAEAGIYTEKLQKYIQKTFCDTPQITTGDPKAGGYNASFYFRK